MIRTEYNGLTAGEKPWQTQELPMPSGLPLSMMSKDEIRYLYWLARDIYSGAGEIIDAGCLRGASTVCLAAGLINNRTVSDKTSRIHSYDIFEYQHHYMAKLFPERVMQSGDSFLPQFMADISDYHDLVEVHAGDITRSHWSGKPVEIIFLDLLKSSEINTHVLREYFSCLIPRRSVIVQQDYCHFYCYWIHLTMARLAEYFQMLPSPQGGTIAFRLLKPIPRELLEIDYVRDLSRAEKIHLLDAAAATHRGIDRLHVLTAKITLLAALGNGEDAYALAETVYRSPDWETPNLLGELADVLRLLQRTFPGMARSSAMDLLAEWDDRMHARRELRLSGLASRLALRPVLIWGAGPTGSKILDRAHSMRISVAAFLDRDPALCGKIVDGLMVQSPEILAAAAGESRPYVLIGSHAVRDISRQLESWGFHYEADYAF